MILMRAVTVGIFTFMALQSAYASNDASWNQLFAKVNGTCIGKSGISSPEASAPVVFDDTTGKIGLLLRGAPGKGKPQINVLCLYDKKTGKASVSEFRWLGR